MSSKRKGKKQEFNKVQVIQCGSPIGRKYDQESTLIGLGLNKLHKSVILDDTPSVRGMINKVKHLVKLVPYV